MVKANLKALEEEFDCSGASIKQLYLRQNEIQEFAVRISGAITDKIWILQTTHMSSNNQESSTRQYYSSDKHEQQLTRPRQDSSRTSTNITRNIFPCLRSHQLQLPTMFRERFFGELHTLMLEQNNVINRIQAIAPILGPPIWGPFLKGHISLKIACIWPHLDNECKKFQKRVQSPL